MALNNKQRRFVDEYLIDLNATQAAVRAGYAPKRADAIGYENLRKPEIAHAISERMKDREKRTEITQDRVLKEVARIAFGDPRNVMTWGPSGLKLRASEELTDDDAALVAEVSETETQHGGSLKLKTNDKLKALELLGKHLGMFKEKIELTGKDGGPVETKTERDLTDEELAAELAKYGIKP